MLSGFSKDISWEEIKKTPLFDVTYEQPYLKGKLHHINPKAVFELVAFDSSETYVMVDDVEVIDILVHEYPKAENLEKYAD